VISYVLYGSECWAVDKEIEQRMSVAEIRMLRWMDEWGDKER